MGRGGRWFGVVVAAGLSAAGAFAGEEPHVPRSEALAQARLLLDQSRAAEQGKKEGSSAAEAALELLTPHTKPEKGNEVDAIWHEALLVAAYHGVRTKAEPFLAEQHVGSVVYGVPRSGRWTTLGGQGSQLRESLVQTLDGKAYRTVEFWAYRWDTVYDWGGKEIGGENAKGLAEMAFADTRDASGKVTRRSNRVVKKRLGAGITDAYYYEILHFDLALDQEVLDRNWYFKAKTESFNLGVVDRVAMADGADLDAVDRWEIAEGGPELEAFLDSVSLRRK